MQSLLVLMITGATCGWDCCVAKASPLQLPLPSALLHGWSSCCHLCSLEGLFCNHSKQSPSSEPHQRQKTLKPVASCLHPLLRLCSSLSLSYDFAERTCQQPGNYSQQNGICHPDSGKQTVNAFTLVLQKTEDRIYLLGLQERHSDTFTRCFLDQEHKG